MPASPSPAASAAAAPPAPTQVTMEISSTGFGGTASYTVAWNEAVTAGVTMRIYGATECLNAGALAKGQESVPCLVPGMFLPADTMTLVATAPAAAGTATWTSAGFGNIGPPLAEYDGKDFYAFVIGAYNAAGHSALFIAETAAYCPDCTT